jgi:hypothetical protein
VLRLLMPEALQGRGRVTRVLAAGWILGRKPNSSRSGVRSRGFETARILVSALHGCGHSPGLTQTVRLQWPGGVCLVG